MTRLSSCILANTQKAGLQRSNRQTNFLFPSPTSGRRKPLSTTIKAPKQTPSPSIAPAPSSCAKLSNAAGKKGGRMLSSTVHEAAEKHGLSRLGQLLCKPRTIPIPRWISPRHYVFTYAECFGHASFILVAVSYAVDDFILLRIIAVAGSTAMLFFTYYHPYGRILWLPLKWNSLFIAINSWFIGKDYLDHYWAERLPLDFMKLRDKNFYLMDPSDFAKLVKLGHVKEYQAGEVIIQQDEENPYVSLVMDGHLSVYRDGGFTYDLEEANFLTELGLHVGLFLTGSIESNCTVVADTDARLLLWDRTELVELMRRDAGVRRSLKATLTWDIVRKLKAQRLLQQSGRIDDVEAWTERRNQQTEHRYIAILHNLLSCKKNLYKRRRELNKYRMIHHIDDDVHNKALEECGWTPEEFELGHKIGDTSVLDDEEGFFSRMYDSFLDRLGYSHHNRPGW